MTTNLPTGSFLDDWIYPTFEQLNKIEWKLSANAQLEILGADYSLDTLHMYQILGTQRIASRLGNNPFVALSGGVDSQAACLLLKESGVKFTAAIMEFRDGLNDQDVSSALNFCEVHSIPFVVVSFDILRFLTRDLQKYVKKYQCPSPQLSAHCAFYELLIEKYSPSTIICGGNPPCIRDGKWEFISNRSHSVWMTFAKQNSYPLIGNFLGYSLDIALPFMCVQPDMSMNLAQRYEAKVNGMHRLGLDVIPQKQKYTGFERVKKHFEEMTNDGWFFEKAFRLPNHNAIPEFASLFVVPAEVELCLSSAHTRLNPRKENQ
jgi:hypothetical protein